MFEGQHGTTDEGLAELVAEVRCTIAGLDENLLGGLIEPFPYGKHLFPLAFFVGAGIAGHVYGCAGNGP